MDQWPPQASYSQCLTSGWAAADTDNMQLLHSECLRHEKHVSNYTVFITCPVHPQPHPPAATATADPALLPQLPVLTFHGLRVVTPSNQTSPHASSPVAVLASNTPPEAPDKAENAQDGCKQQDKQQSKDVVVLALTTEKVVPGCSVQVLPSRQASHEDSSTCQ